MVASGREGRPAKLTRDTICRAAQEVLAASGAADFSMRALGEKLGVDPTAVYRHFADKDELMREVGDRALAPATRDFTTTDDPRADARRMCIGLRGALLKNQVGLTITSRGPTRQRNELRITEILLDAFLRAGIEPRRSALGYHALIEYSVGSAALDAPLSRSAQVRRDTYKRWKDDYSSLPADEFPAIHAFVDDLYPSSDEVFEVGLDALLSQLMRPQ